MSVNNLFAAGSGVKSKRQTDGDKRQQNKRQKRQQQQQVEDVTDEVRIALLIISRQFTLLCGCPNRPHHGPCQNAIHLSLCLCLRTPNSKIYICRKTKSCAIFFSAGVIGVSIFGSVV